MTVASQPLQFTVEHRDGINVVAIDAWNSRPASDAEVALWRERAALLELTVVLIDLVLAFGSEGCA